MAGPGCSRSTARRSGTRRTGRGNLEPLAPPSPSASRSYLPRLTYPIRTGTHFNTAFAMILALEWAEANDADSGGPDPRACGGLLWRGRETAPAGSRAATISCPRRLIEALCMRRVLGEREFRAWFDRLPSGPRRRRAAQPVHARLRLRPLGRQDRPSRRLQPQPRLVLARPRRRAGRRPRRELARHRRRPSRRQPAARRRRLYGRALARDLRLARAGAGGRERRRRRTGEPLGSRP